MFLLTIVYYFVIAIILLVLYNKLTCTYSNSLTYLWGKTAIVTGGNSGIGLNVAKLLAARGCKVIIADVVLSNNTKAEIIKETNNDNIVLKHLDLCSFNSVRSFAAEILKEESRLDILIHNAGIVASNKITEDGLCDVTQVNHFSPFLLTHLLADLLKKSAPSRIVFTSSDAGIGICGKVTEDNLIKPNPLEFYHSSRVYGLSKTAIAMASTIFAKKLKKYGVTSNSLHPAVCAKTSLVKTHYKKEPIWKAFEHFMFYICGKSTVFAAAQNTFHVATSMELANETGNYYRECKRFFQPLQCYNLASCELIWNLSEKTVQLKDLEKLKHD